MKKILIYTTTFVLGGIISLLLFLISTEYSPEKTIQTKINNRGAYRLINKDTLNLLSWNIGYSGLGKEMDFFNDGGDMIIAKRSWYNKYQKEILKFIKLKKEEIDFFLFQEVDIDSKRSYFINQRNLISNALPEFNHSFGLNYDVQYIPYPVHSPYGKVEAGILNYSRFTPETSHRHAYPDFHEFPYDLVMLKRCVLESRFLLKSKKELVIFNTHNSYYVKDSLARYQELQILKDRILDEYEKGNYVIAGGDWNQNPPLFNSKNQNYKMMKDTHISIPENYLPKDWTFAFDANLPTSRSLDIPYTKDKTNVSLIDFFVLSPNIELLEITTTDLEFKDSDHNPVEISVVLK